MAQTIKIFETVEKLAQYFASFLVSQVIETPDHRNFTWVLSGGITPKIIFREIASTCRDNIDWSRLNVFWGDERCVGPEDTESNFKMARENLLGCVPIPASNVFRIHGEADFSGEAERYAGLFKMQVVPVNDIPQVDLIMLGLGEDGHTASIFPATIDLFNSDQIFVSTEHPVTKQKRITVTGKIINHAKMVVIVATGEAKALMVARIINHLPGWDQLPAGRICPDDGELIWLLDKDAASKLQPL